MSLVENVRLDLSCRVTFSNQFSPVTDGAGNYLSICILQCVTLSSKVAARWWRRFRCSRSWRWMRWSSPTVRAFCTWTVSSSVTCRPRCRACCWPDAFSSSRALRSLPVSSSLSHWLFTQAWFPMDETSNTWSEWEGGQTPKIGIFSDIFVISGCDAHLKEWVFTEVSRDTPRQPAHEIKPMLSRVSWALAQISCNFCCF